LKQKSNEEKMIIDAGNNPFYVSKHGKGLKNATNQNKEGELTEYEYSQKCEKEVKNTSKTMTQKSRNTSENSSLKLPSSSDIGPENDKEIKFDFTSVEIELLREQSNEWEVGTVNVSQRFKKYQIEIIEKAKTYGIKWSSFHEVLE
ncbi:2071_t:CDS:2, partial [Dentiscutata erythropus]